MGMDTERDKGRVNLARINNQINNSREARTGPILTWNEKYDIMKII